MCDKIGEGYDIIRISTRVFLSPHGCDKENCQGGLPFEQAIKAAANRGEMFLDRLRNCKTWEEYKEWEDRYTGFENMTHYYKGTINAN